jgi:aldehyde dehydrogenase (NAD+)
LASVTYEPTGTVLIIAPWNFPFNLAIGPLVSALAAGNTVMLKPSELTVNTAILIERMCEELFDESEVKVVQGGVEETSEILKCPFDHIFFTGSPNVGKIVMRAASENLTSVTLELGGKSPLIVDESANLNDVASKLVWGKYINNGQTCLAPDYVLVPEGSKRQLIELIRLKINEYFNASGEGIHRSEDYARIINAKNFQRLVDLLTDAIEKGAEVEAGGHFDKGDLYFEPTVLSNIHPDSRIFNEEIFGPILPVITYQSMDEAVDLVTNKPKPLAYYIFASKGKVIKELNQKISAGTACINDCVIQFLHPYLPFGGVNNSGIGKSHGHSGFLAFSNEKPMLKQKTGITALKPLYPPYSGVVKNMVDLLMKHF